MQIYRGIELLGGIDPDCNVYLIDGELLVDAGTGIYFGGMKKEIGQLCDIKNIKLLVNTHCHFDHTGGNKKFQDWLKLSIAAHTGDKKAVETGNGSMAELFGQKSRIMTVNKALRAGAFIKTTNFVFEVMQTPGHTPGSICLYEKNKRILISGDTLFENTVGRTDLPGGDRGQLINSLKALSELQIEYLLPGHGSPKKGGVDFLIKQMINFSSESKKI
ncbi:MAG: MBL fold metallo-hydrolase [Candidatus Aenigmarchaeota archaeon]|nr:MBL fold metallo-hydrolase [Candidatus Aenigmarchaeota archaeon]